MSGELRKAGVTIIEGNTVNQAVNQALILVL
jgi:hypothetical protein